MKSEKGQVGNGPVWCFPWSVLISDKSALIPAAQAQSASSSGSPRKKFFEDLTEKKDGGMMRSYPNIRLNETVSDFDRRVLKLRVSIAEARDLLSKSTPNLAVRSSMPIDPTSLSLGPAAGPLPPPGAFQVDLKEKTGNRSIGTSTDPCLVIPYPAFSALQLPPAWIKFLSPSPTFPHAKPGTDKAKEREEWSERVGRAQDYYRRTPSAPSPLTFSKVLQSELDLDTSGRLLSLLLFLFYLPSKITFGQF